MALFLGKVQGNYGLTVHTFVFFGIFYGFVVGPPSLAVRLSPGRRPGGPPPPSFSALLRLRAGPRSRLLPGQPRSVPGCANGLPKERQQVGPSAVRLAVRFFRKRRGSACRARRLALSLAPRPAVLPPAAPRAPWPSPLPGAALSRSSVNSMRGWLFGGWPPLRALRVPGNLPALPPGSLRSSGVVRRAGRPAATKWVGKGPLSRAAP